MLLGLKKSGVNFLWVARGDTSQLNAEWGSNGLVVECVPTLTFPITGEQMINSKVIVDDWKNGSKLKSGSLIEREEIVAVVRQFMDLESVERKEMMERVEKLQGAPRKCNEGGSATIDIDRFVWNNFR
nr:UDP-glycosyltransferase 87A1-like [Tanacetum cinerariifolium]